MKPRSFALAGTVAAALFLAACGSGDDEPEEAEPVAQEPGPALDAEPPAMEAEPPAMEAEPPAMEAEGGPISLASITGLWGESADLCENDPMTITGDIFAAGDLSCVVSSVEDAEGGLSVGLLCPVAGAPAESEVWIVIPIGAPPYTAISIAMGDATVELSRCP